MVNRLTEALVIKGREPCNYVGYSGGEQDQETR